MKRCERCGKNRQERFYTGPRSKTCVTCLKKARSEATHRRRVGKTYGLEPGDYDALIKGQDGRCAICQEKRNYRLAVDHDHKTGLVRGAACKLCNSRLLTAARDSPEILRRAADYLENPPALRIIGSRYASDQANQPRRQSNHVDREGGELREGRVEGGPGLPGLRGLRPGPCEVLEVDRHQSVIDRPGGW